MNNKNEATLKDFTAYCEKNPHLRFWQALKAWAGVESVRIAYWEDGGKFEGFIDTYYFEGREK